MIAHVVLLQPRETLTADEKRAALDALSKSTASVPGIARFRIGRRVRHGLPGYEQQMAQDYAFALVLEFESIDALTAYLAAPAHGVLGNLFTTATSAALAYDYDLREAGELEAIADEWLRRT
ncbi:MAG TPA: Dabb family protein [Vicinamibacterales bacterium]|nr:Dabb family protein [Vicinamibacterales bacterium]